MAQNVNIQVAVRIRPATQTNKLLNYNHNQIIIKSEDQKNVKNFKFDVVLRQQSSQNQVFQKTNIQSLIQKVLNGYNSTIFAYGQTGSGKTFTMQGYQYDVKKLKPIINQNRQGIIPKTIRTLYKQIKQHTQKKISISCSFLQIYNQKIYDLFSNNSLNSNNYYNTNDTIKSAGLKLRWDKQNQFTVENLQMFQCQEEEQMIRHWNEGLKNRFVATHRLNLTSSRSHTIFTIKVSVTDQHDITTISKLQLVDLAGSERILSEGRLAKESIDINKSLFTLRKVIANLQSKQSYVPYRESKLTSLLKNSIGGNSFCLILACINPNDKCIQQTISTLSYGTKAKSISNVIEKMIDKKDKLIEQLRKQNQCLRQELISANKQIQILNRLQCQQAQKNRKSQEIRQIELKKQIQNKKQIAIIKQQSKTQFYLKKQLEKQKQLQIRREKRLQNKMIKYKQQIILDSEYFSQRLIESVNTIRELLKSNKNLRQQLDNEKSKSNKYLKEIQQLMIQNQQLKVNKLQPINNPLPLLYREKTVQKDNEINKPIQKINLFRKSIYRLKKQQKVHSQSKQQQLFKDIYI